MEQTEKVTTTSKPSDRFFAVYRQTLPAVLRHPATWLLAILWLASSLFQLLAGRSILIEILLQVVNLVILLLVLPLTQGAPLADWERPLPSATPWRLWLQVGMFLFCAGILGLMDLLNAFHISLPVVTPFYRVLQHNVFLSIATALLFEAVLPLGFILLFGMKWRELGLRQGYHVWRTTILVCAPMIVLGIVGVVEGKITALSLLVNLILLLFVAGLPEEVGFRGILMTRLMRLVGTGWGIALSALIFGLFHFGVNMTHSGSTNILLVLAETLSDQMVGGFAFAVLFQRTRSLVPGIIAHALSDSLPALF